MPQTTAKTSRAALKSKKTAAAKSPKGKRLRSITIDLDDKTGGTVRCSYGGNDAMPFGGNATNHAFESRESIATFVKDELLSGDTAEVTAAADVAKGPVDTAPAAAPAEDADDMSDDEEE